MLRCAFVCTPGDERERKKVMKSESASERLGIRIKTPGDKKIKFLNRKEERGKCNGKCVEGKERAGGSEHIESASQARYRSQPVDSRDAGCKDEASLLN
jgi:hypothetical protein